MRPIENTKPVSDRELEQRYCDMLDAVYDTVKICGYEYSPSMALQRTDPIAFRVGFADWISMELDETLIEIDGEYFDRSECIEDDAS